MSAEPNGLCNCPNCATNNCPNADDTRLHGAAVALMGLLDAFERDGGDVEQLLFLAQTWREQEAIKREHNPGGLGARVRERTLHGRCSVILWQI